MPLERREHRVAARAQQADHALEVRLEGAAPDELVHRRLPEQDGRDVGRRRRRRDLRRELVREDEPPDPQAGRDRLRERRAVDDRAARQVEQRRQRLALVAHEAVRIVLEHQQVVLGRQLGDAAPAIDRQRAAARVLEGRDQVEERRRRRRRARARARRRRGRRRRSAAPRPLRRAPGGSSTAGRRSGSRRARGGRAPGAARGRRTPAASRSSGRRGPGRRRGARRSIRAAAGSRATARRRGSCARRARAPRARSRQARRLRGIPARERRGRRRSSTCPGGY